MSSALIFVSLLHTFSSSIPVEARPSADTTAVNSQPSANTPDLRMREPARRRAPSGVRIAGEWVAGNVTFFGVTAIGAFSAETESGFYLGLVGGGIAGGLASPLVVTGVGHLLGGEGSVWGAYAGLFTPVVLGLSIGALAGDWPAGLLVGTLLGPTGAVVGYELTQRPRPAGEAVQQTSVAPRRPSLHPWVQADMRDGLGARMGLAGSF